MPLFISYSASELHVQNIPDRTRVKYKVAGEAERSSSATFVRLSWRHFPQSIVVKYLFMFLPQYMNSYFTMVEITGKTVVYRNIKCALIMYCVYTLSVWASRKPRNSNSEWMYIGRVNNVLNEYTKSNISSLHVKHCTQGSVTADAIFIPYIMFHFSEVGIQRWLSIRKDNGYLRWNFWWSSAVLRRKCWGSSSQLFNFRFSSIIQHDDKFPNTSSKNIRKYTMHRRKQHNVT
jgi:hypothetical protein